MRSKNLIPCLAAIAFLFSFTSCEKKTEEFTTEAIAEYLPLTVGKYISYRLDSTVFTNFGRNEETHRYQVKHVVDAQVTDNLGRPSFRILRYLRDSSGTQPWVENGTYFITNLTDQAEVIEDNLLRIGQEALTNVIKHSGATNVTIELDFKPQCVALKVEDDGKGFVTANSASGSEGHFGLVGITERTKRLDGKFTIKSAPGAGTCLLVEIPIASAAPTKDAPSSNGSTDA